MIERDLLGLELDDVLEGYECDFVVEPRDVLLDPGVRMRLDEANAPVGSLTAHGHCKCSHEQGESFCDVHPTCEVCSADLSALTSYTSPPLKRLCRECYEFTGSASA